MAGAISVAGDCGLKLATQKNKSKPIGDDISMSIGEQHIYANWGLF